MPQHTALIALVALAILTPCAANCYEYSLTIPVRNVAYSFHFKSAIPDGTPGKAHNQFTLEVPAKQHVCRDTIQHCIYSVVIYEVPGSGSVQHTARVLKLEIVQVLVDQKDSNSASAPQPQMPRPPTGHSPSPHLHLSPTFPFSGLIPSPNVLDSVTPSAAHPAEVRIDMPQSPEAVEMPNFAARTAWTVAVSVYRIWDIICTHDQLNSNVTNLLNPWNTEFELLDICNLQSIVDLTLVTRFFEKTLSPNTYSEISKIDGKVEAFITRVFRRAIPENFRQDPDLVEALSVVGWYLGHIRFVAEIALACTHILLGIKAGTAVVSVVAAVGVTGATCSMIGTYLGSDFEELDRLEFDTQDLLQSLEAEKTSYGRRYNGHHEQQKLKKHYHLE